MVNRDKIEQVIYPIGNPLVPYGTPLHTTELFLQLLKIVFSEMPEDYPFRYIQDDYENTGIAFDVTLNKESKIYGKKPLVVVGRGQQSVGVLNVGDLAFSQPHQSYKGGSNLVSASLDINIISRVKAEIEIIAQTIFGVLMMRRTHMPRAMNIHMIDSITLSEVNKIEEDDIMLHSQLLVNYTQQYIWTQTTDDPVLRSIGLSISKIQ